MNNKEAKELTLIKWRFRRDNPLKELPRDILVKLVALPQACPLCSLFGDNDCYGCPLVLNRTRCGAGVFKQWSEAFERDDWDAASYFAGKIVEAVEKWNVFKEAKQ
jgi:hypothetical protein